MDLPEGEMLILMHNLNAILRTHIAFKDKHNAKNSMIQSGQEFVGGRGNNRQRRQTNMKLQLFQIQYTKYFKDQQEFEFTSDTYTNKSQGKM